MKLSQYYVTVAIAGVSLVLGIASLVLGHVNSQIRDRTEANNVQIEEGARAQQFFNMLVQDTAQAAMRDAALEQLLRNNGIAIRPPGNPGGTNDAGVPAPPQ